MGHAGMSAAEMYTQRLERDLESILVELRKCGNYDNLPQSMRTAFFFLISGKNNEVLQCDKEAIASVEGKLLEIKDILESDKSESYILKVLILPHLRIMVGGLAR